MCADPIFWCSQELVFKSSPQMVHKPLQSGLHKRLIGISINIYSRTIGPRSIFPSSGRINSDSDIVRELNAKSSLNSVRTGCWKSARQRTHWAGATASKWPCATSPCGVRETLTTPLKNARSKSGWRWTLAYSKWKSRL